MDIQSVINKAMTNVFITLIDEGFCPRLECEGKSLTLWTEDASCEAVIIVDRKHVLFGEKVFSLVVTPGEGNIYLAEMVADEVVNFFKGGDDE